MLETGRPADAKTVKHIDRCLSCLACTTTCPSGVDYMHLVDQARAYIEQTYKRPLAERVLRGMLARVIPYPRRFRLALFGARLARPIAGLLPDRRLRAMVAMAPDRLPPVSRNDDPQTFPAVGTRRMRVALMTGCAQKALDTDINDATIRLLTRLGCEVVIPRNMGCCGALVHHMGREAEAKRFASANVRALGAVEGLEGIIINTSGCGTTVKDYGFMFRAEPGDWPAKAERVTALAMDISEALMKFGYAPTRPAPGLTVAYHSACSLQHGQKITAAPKDLLKRADIISLHAPATSVTTEYFNAARLATMQPHAMIVNSARGQLIVEADLADALTRGVIAGAALDVFHVEPLPADSPLRQAPNLLLMPHAAWYSEVAIHRLQELVAEDIARALRGEGPRKPVPM